MDYRTQLVNTLKLASQAVSPVEAMAKDLNTMAHALASVSEEKFSSMISKQALEDMFKQEEEEKEKSAVEISSEEIEGDKKESECKFASSECWNKQASNLVREALAKEVVGFDASPDHPDGEPKAALPKEQTPDGSNNPGTMKVVLDATDAKLEKEQKPDLAAVLDSEIVSKSNGAVEKEASVEITNAGLTSEQTPDGSNNPGTVKEMPGATDAKLEKDQLPKHDEALKSNIVDKSKTPVEKEASEDESSSFVHEGVEMPSSDITGEVKMSEDEKEQLDGLFN